MKFTITLPGRSPKRSPLYCLILITFLFVNNLNASTWYVNKTQNGDHLQYLIDQASSGDVIYFIEAGNYNMNGKVIVVDKAITFQGFTPNGYNATVRGSSGIGTNLTNVTSFLIRSNDVKFNNIKITAVNNEVVLIDARSQTYIDNFRSPGYTADDQYTGIGFTNVELSGGFYSCFAGNGMQVDFKNVSFLDFGRIGYINDRRTRVNGMKKATFFRCKFKPVTPSGAFGFDSRGISLDAGNTSYPVVWSGEGTYILECDFENTGVALSRIKNVNISVNTFTDNNAYVDMLHVEEFSNNILISYNQFVCNAQSTRTDFERSRIITLDSELQAVTNINIQNNTVSGEYNFFVNGYAPTNLSIKDNNLSNAYPFGVNMIDFKYYENRYKTGEEIATNQEFVSRNITITGNTGFQNWSKGCQINIPYSGGNNNIANAQFAPGKLNLTTINNPVPLRGTGIYEIVNAGNTNRKLASDGNNYTLKTANASNNSVKWEITWIPPFYYHIKNVGNNRHLETHKGYTEKEILDGVQENVYPFLAYQSNDTPKWILRNGGVSGLFKILPAGNEKQSVLAMAGTTPKLIMHKQFNSDGTRSVKEPNNFGRWWINPSSTAKNAGNLQETPIEGLQVVPNIVSDIASIYYEDENNPVISVAIYNAAGIQVRQEKIYTHTNNVLDVSQLASGIYLLRSSNDFVKRLVVK